MLSIVVPTYNERENLPVLLERVEEALRGYSFEVIVVDDDSPDGTWRLAERLARERYPWLRVIRRVGVRGLASAVIDGFRAARGRYVAVMDADLQHPPEELARMLRTALETGAELVVASRYTRGGGVEGWSRVRLLISRGATLLARLLLPESRATSDPMSGFFIVERRVLEGCLDKLRPRGYKILLEILVKCRPSRVVDHPYVFRRRLRGRSKLGFRTIIDYVLHVLELNEYRVFKNMAVGASGVAVLWLVLHLLSDILGVPALAAYAAAIEASIINNFTWNHLLVFRGRGGGKSLARRLAEYHGAVALGAVINYAVFSILYTLLGVWKYAASLAGVVLGWAANYLMSEHRVWAPHTPSPRKAPASC